MATVTRIILRGYRYFNDEVSDSRVNGYFLMGSPWPILSIVSFYLYFVFDLGPKLMANRQPFKLDKVVQVYDAIQIACSSYIFYQGLILAWLVDYSFFCQPIDYSNDPRSVKIASTVWCYFLIKILDLLDTVFFVLRKKQNQISFLHVYHHAGMVLGGWTATKWLAGGHVTFLGVLNSFVHVVMYTHYLVMSFKIWKPWWKKYITQLQLCQFIILLYHFAQLLWVKDCAFPKWPAAIFIPQNLFMTLLFLEFYYKTYIKKPSKPKASLQNDSADSKVSSNNNKEH